MHKEPRMGQANTIKRRKLIVEQIHCQEVTSMCAKAVSQEKTMDELGNCEEEGAQLESALAIGGIAD